MYIYIYIYVVLIVSNGTNCIDRIPLDVMHSVQTTLLFSLEALQEVVQWDKIVKSQSRDGSFLSSPAATAAAYMITSDTKCLEFLTFIVNRFGDHGKKQLIKQIINQYISNTMLNC